MKKQSESGFIVNFGGDYDTIEARATAAAEILSQKLTTDGWAVIDRLVPDSFLRPLQERFKEFSEDFKKSRINSQALHKENAQIRGDFILWLDETENLEIFNFLRALQNELNRQLFWGLRNFECHLATYPEGKGYERHVDNPGGKKSRQLTFLAYLNTNWNENFGGELEIFSEEETSSLARVLPVWNRWAFFLSEKFPHQVHPSTKSRQSLSGWYRHD